MERAEAAQLLELPTFFLYPSAVEQLLDPDTRVFAAARLDATFAVADGPAGLERGITALADAAVTAVDGGAAILVVSDAGIGADRAPIPSLLAAGAVHHRLVETRTRQQASIVVDSGDARDVHAVACLLGYGADAVCPRLALESVASMADDEQLGELPSSEAQSKIQAAIEDGVLKIFSKMGISTVDGYRAAQIFEAIGLGGAVVDRCLRFTDSQVGGVGFERLGADVLARHEAAYGESVAARRARLHPVPQAGRRVPRQPPRRGRRRSTPRSGSSSRTRRTGRAATPRRRGTTPASSRACRRRRPRTRAR